MRFMTIDKFNTIEKENPISVGNFASYALLNGNDKSASFDFMVNSG